MLKAKSRSKNRLLVILFLASSVLVWFLLLRSKSLHHDEDEASESKDDAYEVKGDYINLSTTLSGLDLDDAHLGEDLVDASHANADADFLDPEPPALVAIVPVTSYTVEDVSRALPQFLPLSDLLQEVILLCPDELSPAVRDRLREVLPDDDFAHVEISVTTWLNGLDEGSALLYAARQLHADRVIIFDSDSIRSVSDGILGMLVAPLLTPLPIGPRGFRVTGDRIACIEAEEDPKPAAFLVPPFSVATILIPPHDLSPDPVYDIWHALGKHIARARFEGVGGVAVSRGVTDGWCSGGERRPVSSLEQERTAQSTFKLKAHDGAPEVKVGHLQHGACSSMLAVFALVFNSEEELHSFAPAACRLRNEGHMVYVATIAARADSAQAARPRFINLFDCAIEITELRQTAAQLDDWLATLPCSPAAVVTSELDPLISAAIVQLVAARYGSDTTLVRIPDGDMPYCDWMGSLTASEWRNWRRPLLEISVITDDRPASLARLLASLSAAHFYGDTVGLRINVEQTAGPQTLQLVHDFEWPHGPVFVHRRVIHGGLLPAVVESWYPQSQDSYGLMLEDDVELSPLFYAWIKMGLLHYRYGEPADRSPQMFGISLYQQKNLELRPEGRHRFNARTTFAAASLPAPDSPYLSQIPCSWGAVYFPEHWRTFHTYLAARLSGEPLPVGAVVAPGLRSNRWTRSWKKYFVELAHLRGLLMLYPNYAGFRSLSTNHLEVGQHVRETTPAAHERKKRLYQLPLLRPQPANGSAAATGLLELPEGHMPAHAELPVLDLLGLLATEDGLRARGAARTAELVRCADAPPHLRPLFCE
ncbi:hypothetical protein PsYK624_071340 [Phanerochaete sordida]|uniref:Uncharacterized protein n=1 Tax=Phanerochaete sordida TaxID=48140 RepID=A0A9P3LEH2_9APHY|nr:hypothetical protein PsYK624_071340 [Phanerochaete sordida]